MRNLMLLSLLTTLLLGGCTFVKLSSAGENVAVLQASEVANCTSNGTITVTVARMAREPARVAQDLRTMARNRAAQRGSDTVVPVGAPTINGEQDFNHYRCRR